MLKNDNIQFNCNIIIDIFYLKNGQDDKKKPVLYIVDEDTAFQAVWFLLNISALHVWEVLKLCWIDVYIGPLDFITHNAGTQFTSSEFKELAQGAGCQLQCVPVEAHHSIGKVERYHPILQRTYDIIKAEISGINKKITL